MSGTTFTFLRHFAKERHRMTITERDIQKAAHDPVYAGKLIRQWDELDRAEVALSPEGRRQAEMVCRHLPEYLRSLGSPVEIIYTSPYLRTYESARLLQRHCFAHMPIEQDERLIELKMGVRNLTTFKEICRLWPTYGARAHEQFLNTAPPFGESHSKVRDGRVRSFLRDLTQQDGSALIVTHAGIIECVHQLVYETSDEDVVCKFAEERSARYGSILVFEYDRTADRFTPILDDHCLYELS